MGGTQILDMKCVGKMYIYIVRGKDCSASNGSRNPLNKNFNWNTSSYLSALCMQILLRFSLDAFENHASSFSPHLTQSPGALWGHYVYIIPFASHTGKISLVRFQLQLYVSFRTIFGNLKSLPQYELKLSLLFFKKKGYT